MFDIACYEIVKAVVAEAKQPFVRLDIGATNNNRLGMYNWDTNTIVINPRTCKEPNFVLRYVIFHELGHKMAGRSEEDADHAGRKWYGDASELLKYSAAMCLEERPLYCHILKTYGGN